MHTLVKKHLKVHLKVVLEAFLNTLLCYSHPSIYVVLRIRKYFICIRILVLPEANLLRIGSGSYLDTFVANDNGKLL
jgi:hypothetical protein